jgi:hypothetical protein
MSISPDLTGGFIIKVWGQIVLLGTTTIKDVNGRVSGEQSIDLRLHVVVGRNDVEEILDDAKIEIDAEGIGRQCNPTARHAVGEHRTDGFWNGILLLIV